MNADKLYDYAQGAIERKRTILEATEEFKEWTLQMKRDGLTSEEIAAVNKTAARYFRDAKRRKREEIVDQLVLQLELAIGEPTETPLTDKVSHSFSQPGATEH